MDRDYQKYLMKAMEKRNSVIFWSDIMLLAVGCTFFSFVGYSLYYLFSKFFV